MSAPDSSYVKRQPPKKRTIIDQTIDQVINDIRQGGQELIRQGSAAAGKVKESFRKVKKFLDK